MKTKFKSTNFRGRFKVVDNHGVMWTKTKSKKDAEKIAKELNDTEYNRDVYAQKMFEKDFDNLKLYEAQQVNSKLKQDGYKLPIDYISNQRELKVGDMFQGMIITKISDDGKTITGITETETRKRTIHYDGEGFSEVK